MQMNRHFISRFCRLIGGAEGADIVRDAVFGDGCLECVEWSARYAGAADEVVTAQLAVTGVSGVCCCAEIANDIVTDVVRVLALLMQRQSPEYYLRAKHAAR